jgi:hypothetical protein
MCTLFGMLFRPLGTEEQQVCGGGDNTSTIILNIVEPPATERQPLNDDGGDVTPAGTGTVRSCEHLPNSDDEADDEWKRQRRRDKQASSPSPRNHLLPGNADAANAFGNELDKQSRFTISQPELVAASSDNTNRQLNNHQRNQVCYASQNLKPSVPNGSGIMYQKDIFYSGSLVNVNMNRRRLAII